MGGQNAQADTTHTLALNSSAVTTVERGTETDATYSFSLSANDSTTIEFWEGDEYTAYTGKIAYYAASHNTPSIFPTSNSQNGNIGCWFYNCGTYNGKIVDVKCTFYWQEINVDGTDIFPLIIPTISLGYRSIAFHFDSYLSYEVKIELYSEGEPIYIDMSMTFGDVDVKEVYGIKNNDGTLNSISCVDDCLLYFEEADGYMWVYAGSYNDGNDHTERDYDSLRFEFSQIHSFNLRLSTSQVSEYNYGFQGYYSPQTTSVMLEKYINQYTAWDQASHLGNIYKYDSTSSPRLAYNIGWCYFNGTGYGPYAVSTPTKTVTDSNESDFLSNTLTNDDNTYSYNIYYFVPLEQSTYYYDSLMLQDTLPDEVSYVTSVIYDAAGTDVTSLFTISQDAQTLTATAKDTSVSSFYYTTYKWVITVSVNTSVLDTNSNSWSWTNTATAIVNRTISGSAATSSKTSDSVTTFLTSATIPLSKTSSDTSVTDGNDNYSLEGAIYTIYTDSACTNIATDVYGNSAEITTDASGNASVQLRIGTYYVKETTAPQGYALDENTYTIIITGEKDTCTFTVNNKSESKLTSVEIPDTITIYLTINGTVTNNGYSLANAFYGIYADESCQVLITTIETDDDGNAQISGLAYGTYYIKEISASDGYELDDTVYVLSANYDDTDNNEITLETDVTALTTMITLTRVSSNTDITDNNSCYELKDACYYVYTDSKCTTRAVDANGEYITLETDANGSAVVTDILAGTYYIKEYISSEGYLSDGTVYEVVITVNNDELVINANNSDVVTATVVPITADADLTLKKEASDDNDYLSSLEGAQFTIKYYGGYYTLDEIEEGKYLEDNVCVRTWVFEVLKDNDGNYTIIIDEDHLTTELSDALFYNDECIVIPAGTITIAETLAPYGYTTNGAIMYMSDGEYVESEQGTLLLYVKADENENSGASIESLTILKQDEYQKCTLTIVKTDSNGHNLSNVSYTLQILNTETGEFDDYAQGSTDEDGILVFSDLPFGEYTVTETGTVYCSICENSKTLLAESFEVTLPLKLTQEDVDNLQIETDALNCEYLTCYDDEGMWYIYELTYTITDTETFTLPTTGGRGMQVYIWASALFTACVIVFSIKRKHCA